MHTNLPEFNQGKYPKDSLGYSKDLLEDSPEQPRIFSFNSWFEWELSHLTQAKRIPQPPPSKIQRDAFLEKLFLLLTQPKDWIALEEKPSQELLDIYHFHHWEYTKNFLPKKELNSPKHHLGRDVRLVEFGSIRKWFGSYWCEEESIWRVSATCNSKVNQREYADKKGIPDGNFPVVSYSLMGPEDRDKILSLPNHIYLIKKDFSSSGGHILGTKDKIPEFSYPAVLEEYHSNKVLDFGILFQIRDKWEFLGMGMQLIGKGFQFLGMVFRETATWKDIGKITQYPNLIQYSSYLENWETWVNENQDYFNLWNSFFPKGPISWDGYILEDGRIRYRSEINYRWSLGRICWELRRKNYQKPIGFYGIFILPLQESIKFPTSFQMPISNNQRYKLVYAEGIE